MIHFEKFNGNPPATCEAVKQFALHAKVILPNEYSRFLQKFDGGEGFIGKSYIILWRLADLLKFNNSYRVSDYAPGLFLFGSDGGGEAFGFDLRSELKSVVSVPFVGMDWESAREIGRNFDIFLETLQQA
jgi:hypothetical protein